MRLLLINPSRGSSYRNHSDFRIAARVMNKKYSALPLALPTVASLTPPDVGVTILDEEIEPIDFDVDADLIGITAMTFKAKRAYQIATEFRKRGKHVVMGGIHASMLPKEALQYVDTVVVGEAESVWDQVIDDFKCNKIEKLYRSTRFADLNTTPAIRRNLIKNEDYTLHMLQTARGCPFGCIFCSVQKFNGRNVRLAGKEKVREELENILSLAPRKYTFVEKSGGKYAGMVTLFIVDDNFTINKEHAIEICNLIKDISEEKNIKIEWMTHADIGVAKNDILLETLSRAGCKRLFIGFESLEDQNLTLIHKNARTSHTYSKAIEKIYSYGIDLIASFIVGNDFDTAVSADELVDFINQNNLLDVLISVLTPYPGTDLFSQLKRENRILSKDWDRYDFGSAVFQPKNFSADELLKIQDYIFSRIYSNKLLYSKLITREKQQRFTKNKLLWEQAPNKYFIMFMVALKAMKILKEENMGTKVAFSILPYALRYAYNIDSRLSMRTISGFIHFIDKIHYMHWKQEHDNISPHKEGPDELRIPQRVVSPQTQ